MGRKEWGMGAAGRLKNGAIKNKRKARGEKKGKERKWKGNERGRIQLSRQIQPITPATIISGCSLLGICLSVE